MFAACWCPLQVKVLSEGITDFRHSVIRYHPQRHVAGDTGDQIPGHISAHNGYDNGADSQPYPRLYEQLRQPLPVRFLKR